MPEPQPHPHLPQVKRVARHALIAGAALTLMKFGVFALTDSAAVLSDAMESIINVAAAGVMLYTLWLANRPADRSHPYGHGKVEFMAVGLEGWLILLAGLIVGFEAVRRLIFQHEPQRLDLGIGLLAGIGVLSAALAFYVWRAGKRYDSPILIADGKHLLTDVVSTVGVVVGLLIVRWTGRLWLDPLVAIVMAALILSASWKLLWQSFHGLMDRIDERDDRTIRDILDDEVRTGAIRGYHKVRHRHNGTFHWVDMHLQVNGSMSVDEGHAVASRIEGRIEAKLGQANATAHVEPFSADETNEARADALAAASASPENRE